VENVGDFVKNLGLLDLLVIFVTGILILAGILILIFGRSRRTIYGLFGAALLPLLLGLLDFYLKNKALDRGLGMYPLSAEDIKAGRREVLIVAGLSAAGTAMLVLMGLLGLVWKRGGKT